MAGAGGGLRTYAAVLRHGPAVRPFAAAVLARLPISMAPLGMVLLVQQVRSSYAVAGLVTGSFAVGTAVGSPLWGRAMDRWGQARVLVPTVLASAALLAALATGAVGGRPDPALVALAGAAGLGFPPFTTAMRASWRATLPDPARRRAGYALDAVAVEAIFVAGPLLLSVLLVLTPPVAPLLLTAGVLATGGLLYASTGAARTRPSTVIPGAAATVPQRAATGRGVAGRGVAGHGMRAVLVASATMAVAFGAIDTSLAATARGVLHDEGRLGLLFAAIAGGSTLGGLAYGTTPGSVVEHRRMPVLLGIFCAGLVPLPFLLHSGRPPLAALLPLLFLAGLAISPSLIIQQNLVDALAPGERVNEAQAWLSTSVTTGVAAGSAAAGGLIQAAGPPASFAAAAAAVAGAALVALGSRRRWDADSGVLPVAGARTAGSTSWHCGARRRWWASRSRTTGGEDRSAAARSPLSARRTRGPGRRRPG